MGPQAIERFQGVGPNIDAQKQAEEDAEAERKIKDKSRSRASSDANKTGSDDVKSNQSTKAVSEANRSRASSDATTRDAAMSDKPLGAKTNSTDTSVKKSKFPNQPKRRRVPKI